MGTVNKKRPILKLTNAAVDQLTTLIEGKRSDKPNVFLRIFAARGCAGIQYGFSFVDEKTDEDYVIEPVGEPDGKSIDLPLLTDKASALLIDGATIDFSKDGTQGPRFIVNNPNDKGGGCAGCAGSCGSH